MRIVETRSLNGVKISNEQEKFVLPFSEISKCLNNEYCKSFYAFTNDGEKVGFALLRTFAINKYFLWVFMINEEHQNKGHGTKFLKKLIHHMRDEVGAVIITTAYNCEDEISKKLFENFGFVQTNIAKSTQMCEVEMVYDMRWLS